MNVHASCAKRDPNLLLSWMVSFFFLQLLGISLTSWSELGRGTSTYDGMAIAGAVLHHLATHSLPLGFFATHYGSLTDDFAYHPNIRRMHMQTHVDDEQKQVVFLYKLIPGVAESSHGTRKFNHRFLSFEHS